MENIKILEIVAGFLASLITALGTLWHKYRYVKKEIGRIGSKIDEGDRIMRENLALNYVRRDDMMMVIRHLEETIDLKFGAFSREMGINFDYIKDKMDLISRQRVK